MLLQFLMGDFLKLSPWSDYYFFFDIYFSLFLHLTGLEISHIFPSWSYRRPPTKCVNLRAKSEAEPVCYILYFMPFNFSFEFTSKKTFKIA